MRRTSSCVLAVAWAVALSTPAIAEEAIQEPAAAQQPGKDDKDKDKDTVKRAEEIVVTATRREQLLQDIHIPVAAVSGDTLAANKIATLEDLQFVVPNMTFGNDFNFAKTYIRGLGFSSSFHGVDPSVAFMWTAPWCPRSRPISRRCSTWRGWRCYAGRRALCTAATTPVGPST